MFVVIITIWSLVVLAGKIEVIKDSPSSSSSSVCSGKCPSPLRNRDVVTLRSWKEMDGDYMIVNFSVKHSVCNLPHTAVITGFYSSVVDRLKLISHRFFCLHPADCVTNCILIDAVFFPH